MKKIFLAGLCLSLSTLACAGAKESLIGKRLVMDIPEVQCAGLSFSKNGKDAAMYAELGQCQDPLHLRVRWLDDKTFILIEKFFPGQSRRNMEFKSGTAGSPALSISSKISLITGIR